MTRTQFLKLSLTVVAGGVSGAVLARSIQVLRPRPATPPRGDFTRFTNAELLGPHHQASQPDAFTGDTVVIWMDYACPSCGTLHYQFKQEKLDPRKLRVVYRNHPLNSHPTAFDLAVTVEAADAQGNAEAVRGWILEHGGYGAKGKQGCLDTLRVNQSRWTRATEPARVRVAHDDREARRFGIKGTPTLILLSDEPPREVFLSDLVAYK